MRMWATEVVGRHPSRTALLAASCSSVLHQRGNLHELDAGAYSVETRYALQKRIGEKRFGCVLGVPDVEIRGLTLSGIDRERLGTQSGHALKPCACGLSDFPHGLLIEIVRVAKRYKYTDHAGLPSIQVLISLGRPAAPNLAYTLVCRLSCVPYPSFLKTPFQQSQMMRKSVPVPISEHHCSEPYH